MSMVCENEHKQIKKYKLESSKRFRMSVVLDIHPGNNVDLDMLSWTTSCFDRGKICVLWEEFKV